MPAELAASEALAGMARFQAEDAENGRPAVPYTTVWEGDGGPVVLVVVLVEGALVVVVDDDGSVVAVVEEEEDGAVVVWFEIAASAVSTSSWGVVSPVSRLAYRAADVSSAVSTMSSTPSPWTSPVMSTLVQASRATGPELATTRPGAGAVA